MTSESEKLMISAAKRGEVAEVQRLLALEPGLVEARDKDGSTPLHCAAWKGHVEVVRVVLDAGADIGARRTSTMATRRSTPRPTGISGPLSSC
jgi:ankyrin repeat protein